MNTVPTFGGRSYESMVTATGHIFVWGLARSGKTWGLRTILSRDEEYGAEAWLIDPCRGLSDWRYHVNSYADTIEKARSMLADASRRWSDWQLVITIDDAQKIFADPACVRAAVRVLQTNTPDRVRFRVVAQIREVAALGWPLELREALGLTP